MKIFAVRHGQTEGNVAQILQSRADGTLTENGIAQAKSTALLLQHETFDAIYCSTLGRCKQTLGYIAAYHLEVPVTYTNQLIELDKGDLEGRTWADLPTDFYSDTYIDARLPGGESWRDVEYRLRQLLNELYAKRYDSVLLVTHDGPLRVLHALVGGIDLSEAITIGYANAGVYTLEMKTELKEIVGDIA